MKQKITVPDSWNEITVGQYQEFIAAERDIERVAIILDTDPEDIRKMDARSVSRVLDHIKWTSELPNDYSYKKFLEIDGQEYRLIENLNGFSLGEWVDIDEYQKDFHAGLHLLLAMLYRPLGEYKAEDVKKRAELFQDKVMIGDVYGAFVFFSLVATKSMQTIQRYLIRQNLKQMKLLRKKGKGWMKKKQQENGAGLIMPTV